mgnify:CR=1 FL=1
MSWPPSSQRYGCVVLVVALCVTLSPAPAATWLGTWLDEPVANVATSCAARVATLDAMPALTKGQKRERNRLWQADAEFARYAPTEDPYRLRSDLAPVGDGLSQLFKSRTTKPAVLDAAGPVLDGLFRIAEDWAATATDVASAIEGRNRRRKAERRVDKAARRVDQARQQRASRPALAVKKLMNAIGLLWMADFKARKAVEKETGFWDYPGEPCSPTSSQLTATYTRSNGPPVGPQSFASTRATTYLNTRGGYQVAQVYLTASTAPENGLVIGIYFQGSLEHPTFPGAGTHSLAYEEGGWMAAFSDEATGAEWLSTGGSVTVTDVDLVARTWSGSFHFTASPNPYAEPPTPAQGTVSVSGGVFQVYCLEVDE